MEDSAPPAATASPAAVPADQPAMEVEQSPPSPAPASAGSEGGGEEPGQKRKAPTPKKEQPRLGVRSSKRQRKAVTMFKPAEIKEKKDLVIPEGEGTKLGDHPNVKRNLDKYQAADALLKGVHKILFGTPGKKTTIKKEIRAFNGFEPGSDTTKAEQAIERLTVAVLTDVVRLLDARKANSGNKEEMGEALLAFLKKPEPSEGAGLFPSKAAPKKRKSKSTKKKGKGRKKKPAKKKGQKRGPSSYFLFCADERANVRAEMPELNGVKEEAKELGRRWKALTEAEREKYKAKAAALAPKKAEAEGDDTDSESEDEHLGEEGKMRARIRVLLRDLSKEGEVSSKQVRKSLRATFGDVVETRKAWVKGLIREEYEKLE